MLDTQGKIVAALVMLADKLDVDAPEARAILHDPAALDSLDPDRILNALLTPVHENARGDTANTTAAPEEDTTADLAQTVARLQEELTRLQQRQRPVTTGTPSPLVRGEEQT